MKIIMPKVEILEKIDGKNLLKNIEMYGRVCYKSETSITQDSSIEFVRKLIQSGHESVLEHEKISVRVICDRGVSHEFVRHRIASFSQESTRYCNYSKDKFGNELTFIKPCFWNEDDFNYKMWKQSMLYVEEIYLKLIQNGASPQEARSVLPNSLKTEIIITMNLREWRHFFSLRTSKRAHPQMRQIAVLLLKEMKNLVPIVFDEYLIEDNGNT